MRIRTLFNISNVFMPTVLSCLLLLSSCSIKEDRTLCPCYLNVSFDNEESLAFDTSVGVMGWRGVELFRNEILPSECDPYWTKPVRRGEISVSSYYGIVNSSVNGHHITVSPGNQSDSLYAYHGLVDASGDEAFVDVDFMKQFCTVYLSLRKPVEEMKRFRILVEGNTCGFDLLNFEPVSGLFRYEPAGSDISEVVRFRIPRQIDDSMTIHLWYQMKDWYHDDETMYLDCGTFPVGKYISKTGYSWKENELQDVYVTIDLTFSNITISVDGWEEGVTFHYIEQ